MTLKERVFWNEKSYGDSFTINSTPLKILNTACGFIPLIYPLPIALFVNKFIKNIKIGWDNCGWCFL